MTSAPIGIFVNFFNVTKGMQQLSTTEHACTYVMYLCKISIKFASILLCNGANCMTTLKLVPHKLRVHEEVIPQTTTEQTVTSAALNTVEHACVQVMYVNVIPTGISVLLF